MRRDALLCCLLLAALCLAPAAWAKEFRLAASPDVKALDGCRRELKKIESDIAASLDKNLRDSETFALHDLQFFCREAALEIHDIVDVFLMESTPGTGQAFRANKRKELAEKVDFAIWDMSKRVEYAKLNAKGPWSDPSRWAGVRGFAERMEAVFQNARVVLQSLQGRLAAN